MNQFWFKDRSAVARIANNQGFAVRQAYLIQKPTAKGKFSFVIPLKHIFGYCDDYDKVGYGFKHTLTLVRKTDDDAIFRAATNVSGDHAAGKVSFEKLSWFKPHVLPSDAERMQRTDRRPRSAGRFTGLTS